MKKKITVFLLSSLTLFQAFEVTVSDAVESSKDNSIRLEAYVKDSITTHASITARPFFEKRGYRPVKEQQVERKGILLTNYVMVRDRRP